MIFSKSMYYGPHAWRRRAELLENLRERRWQPACYIITAARKPNLYEIWNSVSFLNPRLNTEDVEILGLAYGYPEALRLIQRMLREEGIQGMLMMLLKFLLLFLLAVLLLLLLVLFLLLFVPVRYCLDVERREAAEGHAHFSLHWLFRAAELKGDYDRDGFRYRLRMLHHTIKETEKDEQC